MTRDTRTLETPNKHKVVVYDYISGGEMRRFQSLFLRDMTTSDLGTPEDQDVEKALAGRISANTLLEAQNLLAEMLVVSVDGDKEASIMDLRPEDTEYVIKELDSMAKPATSKKK